MHPALRRLIAVLAFVALCVSMYGITILDQLSLLLRVAAGAGGPLSMIAFSAALGPDVERWLGMVNDKDPNTAKLQKAHAVTARQPRSGKGTGQ